MDDEGNYGYLFEVDLEYARELHAATRDFPLGPESDFDAEDINIFIPFLKSYYASLCDALVRVINMMLIEVGVNAA